MNAALTDLFYTKTTKVAPDGVELPNYGELVKSTTFSKVDIKRIFTRFCTVCNAHGRIDKFCFLRQPEIVLVSTAPLAFDHAIRKLNDANKKSMDQSSYGLDFLSFLSLLNEYSPKRSAIQKVTYLFDIYHVNPLNEDAHVITHDDFRLLLETLMGQTTPKEVIETVQTAMWVECLKKAKKYSSKDLGDNCVDMKTLVNFLTAMDIDSMMTMHY